MTRLEEETRIGKGGTLAGKLSRLDLIVLSTSLDSAQPIPNWTYPIII